MGVLAKIWSSLGLVRNSPFTYSKTTSFSASNGGSPIKIGAVLEGKLTFLKNVSVNFLIDLACLRSPVKIYLFRSENYIGNR